MKRTSFVLALAALCSSAYAQDRDPAFVDALNNTSHELTICAAYYFVAAGGIRNSGDSVTAQQYDDAANHAVELAGVMGGQIGLSEPGFLARLEMAMQDMVRKMDANYVNISILLRDHSDSCLELLNNPEWHVVEYLIQHADEDIREALRETLREDGILP